MDFKSTYTLESTAFPGVTVTLKRMGPKRRAEVELSVSAARSKQRELSMRHEAARQKLVAAIELSPKDADGKPIETELRGETLTFAMELQAVSDEAAALVRAQIHPAFIKAAVKSFGGAEALTYEGKPATTDLLCEVGPDELFDELVASINGNGYLPAEAARNLPLPSTSGAPVDGVSTTAPPAKTDDSILPVAAWPGIRRMCLLTRWFSSAP
jgi:hypothetical protein